MIEAEKPLNEVDRLIALEKLGVLYTPAEERFDRITRLACKIFDVPIALVSLVAENCQWFKSSQGLLANKTERRVSFCAHAILIDEPFVVEDTLKDPRFSDNDLVVGEPYIRFYAGQSIKDVNGIKLGTLCIIDRKERTLGPSEIETLKDMATWVENELKVTQLDKVQIDLINDLESSKREALLDSLTQLWNRKAIMDILDREIERSVRLSEPMSLLMIDIDHFKSINDTHGHLSGDSVLKEVAHRMRSAIRIYDALGRYGGEEFLVILINCDSAESIFIAEKIRKRIDGETFDVVNSKINVSISIGVAIYDRGESRDAVIQKADTLLYKAKHNGRNRVEYF